MAQDTLYKLPRHRVGEFTFDQSVVDVFPDMIARSVPGYASVLSMIEQLTKRFARPDTHLYDLGCSLGAATRLMIQQAPESCIVRAVDNSSAMVARLEAELLREASNSRCQYKISLADVSEITFEPTSFVVLNWTLQFIPPVGRFELLKRICDAMIPGGAMLMSEKIAFVDPNQQTLLTDLHHDFKRAHGYSDLEIAQKRTALENRLIPETLTTHCHRLQQVGFQQVVPWFQCFNFASILAVKQT